MTFAEVADGIRALELAERPVCIHVSMRSFGRLEAGAATVVDGILAGGPIE